MEQPKDKRTKAYKDWKANQEKESQGLGDTIAKVTEATGIKKAVELIAGEDCGCDKRKKTLNKMFPYNKPNCLTQEEHSFPSASNTPSTAALIPVALVIFSTVSPTPEDCFSYLATHCL